MLLHYIQGCNEKERNPIALEERRIEGQLTFIFKCDRTFSLVTMTTILSEASTRIFEELLRLERLGMLYGSHLPWKSIEKISIITLKQMEWLSLKTI